VLACDGAVPARTGFVLVCAAVALPVLLQAAAISAATVSGTAEHQRAMLVPVFFIDPSPLGLGGPARQPLPIDYRPGHIRSEPTVLQTVPVPDGALCATDSRMKATACGLAGPQADAPRPRQADQRNPDDDRGPLPL
jgi:hypothetical protein